MNKKGMPEFNETTQRAIDLGIVILDFFREAEPDVIIALFPEINSEKTVTEICRKIGYRETARRIVDFVGRKNNWK